MKNTFDNIQKILETKSQDFEFFRNKGQNASSSPKIYSIGYEANIENQEDDDKVTYFIESMDNIIQQAIKPFIKTGLPQFSYITAGNDIHIIEDRTNKDTLIIKRVGTHYWISVIIH